VAPSECEGTLLDSYIDQLFTEMTDQQFAFLVAHQELDVASSIGPCIFERSTAGSDMHWVGERERRCLTRRRN